MKPGENVVYIYKSSKGSEKPEWKRGIIQHFYSNFVEISTVKRGPNSRVAYDDLLKIPHTEDEMNVGYKSTDLGSEGKYLA